MKPFKFKEFIIHQDKAAMKIGTDAVLLGAWCSVDFYPDSILDVGSGTGVIALMLAQRTDAMTIDAVELDENAYEQSVENFEQSDWGDRLFCYHASFQEFAKEMHEEQEVYDLIVANPPFYTADFLSEDASRNKARFTNTSLSFEALVKGASKILSETGVFSVVIPFEEENNFIKLAKTYKFSVHRVCRVRGNANSELKRSLLEFSFQTKGLVEEELIIEKERHQYTDAYIDLTKDFYLKM